MNLPLKSSHLILLCIALALILGGCTSLRPLPDVNDATIRESIGAGDKITVVLKNGQEYAITVDQIDADTLIGEKRGQQIRVPLSDIEEIRTRKFSIAKTSLLTLGFYGLAYGYAWAQFMGAVY